MRIKDGDEVAILPRRGASPTDVQGIERVLHAGPTFIQLDDGRLYSTMGLLGLNTNGCIAPATDEHRNWLMRRGQLRNDGGVQGTSSPKPMPR
jgi:hypothetical protein